MPGVLELLSDDQPESTFINRKGGLADPHPQGRKVVLEARIEGDLCDDQEAPACPSIAPSVSALADAIRSQDLFSLRHLLENDDNPINPESLVLRGRTAMHLAASLGWHDGVRELYSAGASANVQDLHGATPLHHAVAGGHLSAVQLLGKLGVRINTVDEAGDSALHYAVRESRAALVPLLLALGANPRLSNDDGETPFDMAVEYGEHAIAAALRSVSVPSKRSFPPPLIAII